VKGNPTKDTGVLLCHAIRLHLSDVEKAETKRILQMAKGAQDSGKASEEKLR
jgi:hypothetical protein